MTVKTEFCSILPVSPSSPTDDCILQAKIAASPLLTAAGKMAGVETKKVLRRLHVTGTQDKREKRRETAPFARLLGKASHANPLAVCTVLVGQVVSQLAPAEVLDICTKHVCYRLRLPDSHFDIFNCAGMCSRTHHTWRLQTLLMSKIVGCKDCMETGEGHVAGFCLGAFRLSISICCPRWRRTQSCRSQLWMRCTTSALSALTSCPSSS